MRFLTKISALTLLAAGMMFGQAPGVPVTGNIGAGGNFPLINSPAVVFATDADHTMAYPEMSGSSGVIKLTSTGSLTATRNLILPLTKGFKFTFINDTTGAQSIQPKGASGTFPAVIANCSVSASTCAVTVATDGVNYYQVGSASAGGVASFDGRTGAVVPQIADYSAFYCPLSGCGTSVQIKYMSVQGCPQGADLNAGTGTDATSCIIGLLAAATAANPVLVVQDGASVISGNGIHGPAGGNWGITGLGGGITQVQVTNCAIAGGVAILTAQNALAAGQVGTFTSDFTSCTALNNARATVLSAGLSSTQFEVAASGSVSSAAEDATFSSAYGTGFYLASGSADAISNGTYLSGGTCEVGAQIPPQRGANILFRDFVLNGNVQGQSNYCFGFHILNMNNMTLDNIVAYNADKYAFVFSNDSQVNMHDFKVYSTAAPTGTNTDGVHIDGPASDFTLSDFYIKSGDDGIALNATEGECGPITRVEISNGTADKAFTMMRAYNSSKATCPVNGLVPLISKIDVSNYSGTTGTHPLILGLVNGGASTIGTLNPAITDFHWSNSTFTSPYSPNPVITVNDNLGDLTFSNINLVSPTNPNFIQFVDPTSGGPLHVGTITVNNMRVVDTPAGSAFSTFIQPGTSNATVGSVTVDGFGVSWEGGSYTPVSCLFCFGSYSQTMGHLIATNIDSQNIAGLIGSGYNDVDVNTTNGLVYNGPTVSGIYLPTTLVTSSTAFSSTYRQSERFMTYGGGTITLTLPLISANSPGIEKCAQNYANGSPSLKIQTATGSPTQQITDIDGNVGALTGYIQSSGAVGDSICMVSGYGANGYGNWQVVSEHGIWTLDGSGATSGGVSKIIAGTNVTISPTNGLGAVTINASGGGGGISGSGTTGYVPLWSGSTALGNSHIDDGVTTGSTITASEPVVSSNAVLGYVDAGGQTGFSINNSASLPGLILSNGSENDTLLNVHYNGGWKYIANGASGSYKLGGNFFEFSLCPTGSAGGSADVDGTCVVSTSRYVSGANWTWFNPGSSSPSGVPTNAVLIAGPSGSPNWYVNNLGAEFNTNITDIALTSGNCVQASTGGLLTSAPCGISGLTTGQIPVAGSSTTLTSSLSTSGTGSVALTASPAFTGLPTVGGTNICLANGANCLIQLSNSSWSIQPALFATATMLGAVHSTPYANSVNAGITIRTSGTISCTVAPVVNLMDLGTSAGTAYGSATSIGSVTTSTSDGVFTGTSSSQLQTNHYYGIAFSSGTCVTAPTFDISVQAAW